VPETTIPKRPNPLTNILRVFGEVIESYSIYTVVVIMLLDILFTASEAALFGISALTFGVAAAPSIIMYGFADIGLMILGFILTVLLELFMGKKRPGDALSLGLISALFLACPSPIFTITVAAWRTTKIILPPKEKQEQLEHKEQIIEIPNSTTPIPAKKEGKKKKPAEKAKIEAQ
jgi:hypothetical protein